MTTESERVKTATLAPPSPKVRGSLAGPAGVIGRDGPILVEKTRPSTVSVAQALPSSLSGPKSPVDVEKMMPPKLYRRTQIKSAQGARARNQAQADADFPLRGFPAHLKHRLQDPPNPTSPQRQSANAAEAKNSRGILSRKKSDNADSLGTISCPIK